MKQSLRLTCQVLSVWHCGFSFRAGQDVTMMACASIVNASSKILMFDNIDEFGNWGLGFAGLQT